MPSLTPAFKLVCPSCGWTKLFPPMGDVRYPRQVPDKCPTFGCENLKKFSLTLQKNAGKCAEKL